MQVHVVMMGSMRDYGFKLISNLTYYYKLAL